MILCARRVLSIGECDYNVKQVAAKTPIGNAYGRLRTGKAGSGTQEKQNAESSGSAVFRSM